MLLVHHLLVCGILLPCIFGETEWGFNKYTEYRPGDMNLIITAPNGGRKRPSVQLSNGETWPNRKDGCVGLDGRCRYTHDCMNTTTFCNVLTLNDFKTLTIAEDIADRIKAITGRQPHVVINHLHRIKMDANREIDEATFGVPDAVQAYQDYANFIKKAKAAIVPGRGLLLDIHGYSSPYSRTQLGYLISKSKLQSGVYSPQMTSIKSLALHWCTLNDDRCFKSFIHGNRSLGHFLVQEGLKAVPSPLARDPGVERYFSGGYTVNTYGSKFEGDIDAIQIKFPRELRALWAYHGKAEVAEAISDFFMLNY